MEILNATDTNLDNASEEIKQAEKLVKWQERRRNHSGKTEQSRLQRWTKVFGPKVYEAKVFKLFVMSVIALYII